MIIKLFHGSNIEIKSIDLTKGLIDKDFGKGFYLTDILSQAQEMAVRRVRIDGSGQPSVTSYLVNNDLLADKNLKVKIFSDTPSADWAKFIIQNRNASKTGFHHNYDIVIGPVADDGVAFQLERYNEGIISMRTLVKELTYRKLNRQYFFGTEKVINTLQKI